jgi:ABC-2 type transport system ATP-binding protein
LLSEFAVLTEGLVCDFNEVRAVDSLDLSVSKGEIYGFLGPNGAGKSTTLRMLTTLVVPTAGRAPVVGMDVVSRARDIRLRIGAALQDVALDNKQTGRALLLQGRLYGLTRREIEQRMKELSSLIDIGGAIDRQIGTYSGGMKRRQDLAAALIHNPEVIFLDEPTTGLDPVSRTRVCEEIRLINKKFDVTIFLTTQYLEEADELADRVGIIRQGQLAVEGTPTELKRSIGSDVIVTRIEGDPQPAAEIVREIRGVQGVEAHDTELIISVKNGAELLSSVAVGLNQSGVDVREITLRTPSLDDVFLQVTGERMPTDDTAEEVAV